jgi:hypothetical protein
MIHTQLGPCIAYMHECMNTTRSREYIFFLLFCLFFSAFLLHDTRLLLNGMLLRVESKCCLDNYGGPPMAGTPGPWYLGRKTKKKAIRLCATGGHIGASRIQYCVTSHGAALSKSESLPPLAQSRGRVTYCVRETLTPRFHPPARVVL